VLGDGARSTCEEEQSGSLSEIRSDLLSVVVDSGNVPFIGHVGRHVSCAVYVVGYDASIIIILITGTHGYQSADPAAATFAGSSCESFSNDEHIPTD